MSIAYFSSISATNEARVPGVGILPAESPRELFLHSSHKSFVSHYVHVKEFLFCPMSASIACIRTLTNSSHSRQTLPSWRNLQGARPWAQKTFRLSPQRMILIDWICQFWIKLQTYSKSQRLIVVVSF